MEGKLMMFVVIASVVQSLLVVSSITASLMLPASESSGFEEIVANQNTTIANKLAGLGLVFDIIEEYAARLIYNLPAGCNNDSATLEESLALVKIAVAASVDSIPIAVGDSACAAVKFAQNNSFHDLDRTYVAISTAFQLAQSSNNYNKSAIKIENIRVQVKGCVTDLIANIYNATRTCLNTTSTELSTAIKTAQEGSTLGLIYAVNGVFNAIKLYADAYAAGCADLSLIDKIEYQRRKTYMGLKDDVENKFGILKAIYMIVQQNEIRLATGLAAIEYAQTAATFRYQEGIEPLVSTISDAFTYSFLGLSDVGKDVSTPEEAAEELMIAKFQAATNDILTSILSIDSHASRTVEAARKNLFAIIRDSVGIFFKEIDIGKTEVSNGSEAVSKIETLNDNALTKLKKYVETIFKVLNDIKRLNRDAAKELTALKKAAVDQIEIFTNRIAKANTNLILITSGNTTALSACMTNFKAELFSAMQNVTSIVSDAEIIVLRS